jgi:hypothetical protein
MSKNYLNHAVQLYKDDNVIIKKVKIEYILSDDTQEKKALKVALINLKHNN